MVAPAAAFVSVYRGQAGKEDSRDLEIEDPVSIWKAGGRAMDPEAARSNVPARIECTGMDSQ
ncbi:hypothetical protein LH128_05515 [Sphingomonas sp. LH128]|uniref:hypothetical protein n=1 Tax=Sphingomonas sp. LH128 TaxID=473781 RepID=UPI00027C9F1C|nr:hypothetical protein [Sphingomonas sp. LH128]EJU14060.1 hypothetical protein LH128_05515 [Sphingomonas sp. LH128]